MLCYAEKRDFAALQPRRRLRDQGADFATRWRVAAMQQLAIGYDDDEEEEEEAPEPQQIELDCGQFEVRVNGWEELFEKQLERDELLTHENFEEKAGQRAVFAFVQKATFDSVLERIFVVRDGAQVHLFNVAGQDICDDTVAHGRQQLIVPDEETGFLAEWLAGYYSAAPSLLASTISDGKSAGEDYAITPTGVHARTH